MEQEFTVSELARRIAPDADEPEIARIVRQLRHWTLTGVLHLAGTVHIGGVHTGAGRHRQYSGDAVYLAAIMVELARMGLPVGALHLVSGCMIAVLKRPKRGLAGKTLPDNSALKLWRRAIEGAGRVCAVFHVLFDSSGALEGNVALYDAEAPDAPLPIIEGRLSAIVVDLTRLFGQIKQ